MAQNYNKNNTNISWNLLQMMLNLQALFTCLLNSTLQVFGQNYDLVSHFRHVVDDNFINKSSVLMFIFEKVFMVSLFTQSFCHSRTERIGSHRKKYFQFVQAI